MTPPNAMKRIDRDPDQPAVIYANGTLVWCQNGKIHRDGDRPAIIRKGKFEQITLDGRTPRNWHPPDGYEPDECYEWYDHGVLHRDHGRPALIWHDGSMAWYVHGKIHRDGDQPAIEYSDGTREWYINGVIHRDGDRPAAEYPNGTCYWYVNGVLHRDGDRPAYINTHGCQRWMQFGIPYRVNGQPNCITIGVSAGWYDADGNNHRSGNLPAYIKYGSGLLWYNRGFWYAIIDKNVSTYSSIEQMMIGLSTGLSTGQFLSLFTLPGTNLNAYQWLLSIGVAPFQKSDKLPERFRDQSGDRSGLYRIVVASCRTVR
jgi:hypothetical protein